MAELEDLKGFDIADADITVWTFKRYSTKGQPPVFNSHWIEVDPALAAALRAALAEARDGIAETHPYGLLAQTNEGSALLLGSDETHAPQIVEKTADPTPARKVTDIKHLNNSAFYVVKLVAAGQTLHAVRRTDDSWRTKRSQASYNVFFNNEGLALDPNPRFSLSKHFDFLIHAGSVFVLEKSRFESVLSYKEAQAEDFVALQAEPLFMGLFADMAPLVTFVGGHRIHLRRACAIRQKGNYADAAYMARLRQHAGPMGFGFAFDAQGRIICTPETCPDIIKALLDHRLDSRLSGNIYDVDNAEVVP